MSPLCKDLCPADGQVPAEGEHLSTDYMKALRGSAYYEKVSRGVCVTRITTDLSSNSICLQTFPSAIVLVTGGLCPAHGKPRRNGHFDSFSFRVIRHGLGARRWVLVGNTDTPCSLLGASRCWGELRTQT